MIYTLLAVTAAFFVPVAVKSGVVMKHFETVLNGGQS